MLHLDNMEEVAEHPEITEPNEFPDYVADMKKEETAYDYIILLSKLKMPLPDKGCDNLESKMKWQGSLLDRLGIVPTPEYIDQHGEHFSNLYCAFLCPTPCIKANEAALNLLPQYEQHLKNFGYETPPRGINTAIEELLPEKQESIREYLGLDGQIQYH